MQNKSLMLVAFTAAMFVCGVSGNTAMAQSRAELKANGFTAATGDASKYWVLVPDNTVPFTDIFVGTDVKVIRGKGEGPQLAPVKVWVGGVEVAPASKGVFLSPATGDGGATYQFLRVHWVSKLMPVEVQGPGFGRVDADDWYDVDGNAFTQFYVPKNAGGAYITSGYTFAVFATKEVQAVAVKSEAFKKVKEKNDKADPKEKPKSDSEADKKDEKKDEKKDAPPAKKE